MSFLAPDNHTYITLLTFSKWLSHSFMASLQKKKVKLLNTQNGDKLSKKTNKQTVALLCYRGQFPGMVWFIYSHRSHCKLIESYPDLYPMIKRFYSDGSGVFQDDSAHIRRGMRAH